LIGQIQPWEALLWEYVSRRLKSRVLIESTDMERRFSRRALAFGGQRL
jgi:hypothetical protein